MPLRCSRCGLEKAEEDFAWRRKAQGLRDSYCRPCRADYKQEHYAKNKARYKENALALKKAEFEARTRYLIEFFREHPCSDCGESDPVVLEFDHLGEKTFDIAHGMRSYNWGRVLEEMRKCDVVCVNCHRRRSMRRGGFWRHQKAQEATIEDGGNESPES